jgi:hypothetical protein
MRATRSLTVISLLVIGAVFGGVFGGLQVSHGRAIPVSGASLIVTMLGLGIILAGLAYPIYRYRKQVLALAKAASNGSEKPSAAPRPKRLDPFYAVRVLALAKSVAVGSALMSGWHLGLVALQLCTPVITHGVWFNVGGLLACVAAMAVALAVEQICKIPNGGADSTDGGVGTEVTPA